MVSFQIKAAEISQPDPSVIIPALNEIS